MMRFRREQLRVLKALAKKGARFEMNEQYHDYTGYVCPTLQVTYRDFKASIALPRSTQKNFIEAIYNLNTPLK